MKIKFLLIILAVVAVLSMGVFYTAIYTTPGSKTVTTRVLSEYAGDDDIQYKSVTGNLRDGLIFTDIELNNLKDLPADTVVHIQKLQIELASFSPEGVQVQVDNLRLYLAEPDPVAVLSGSFKNQQLNIEVQAKKLSASQLLPFVPELKKYGPIEAVVTDLNAQITGPLEEPTVKGGGTLEKILYGEVHLVDTMVTFDTRLADYQENIQIHGNISVEKGELRTKKAVVTFAKAEARMAGPVRQPQLNANTLTIEHLEISQIINLPEGATLRSQRLSFRLRSWDINGIDLQVENARLSLPGSDPVVMSGSIKDQVLDTNIYSRKVTVTEVQAYLPDLKQLVPLTGDVTNIDMYITGNYLEPAVTGSFTIDKFVYKGFILSEAPLTVDMSLKDMKTDTKLFGNVSMANGNFQTQKVLLKLDKGDLYFSGPWNDPRINLTGASKVEKTTINVGLKGTVNKPELNLTSEPSYSQQKLMVMLATGKSWQSIEGASENGFNSKALTKDFIDYFFFAGKSNQFAKRFGISEFSVSFNENSKSVGAKKEFSDKLEVGYQVEETVGQDLKKNVTHTVGGEYKLNKELSVSVEREMQQKSLVDTVNDQSTENNDKIMLKYKKNF